MSFFFILLFIGVAEGFHVYKGTSVLHDRNRNVRLTVQPIFRLSKRNFKHLDILLNIPMNRKIILAARPAAIVMFIMISTSNIFRAQSKRLKTPLLNVLGKLTRKIPNLKILFFKKDKSGRSIVPVAIDHDPEVAVRNNFAVEEISQEGKALVSSIKMPIKQRIEEKHQCIIETEAKDAAAEAAHNDIIRAATAVLIDAAAEAVAQEEIRLLENIKLQDRIIEEFI
jgi:hypothetical protein